MGAKDADPGGGSSAGGVYLFYGGATMAAGQSAADLARFEAGVLNDYLGNLYSLGGGDLDGDGLDEFWAGAYGYDVSPSGGGTVSFQGAVFIWAGQAARRSGVNSAADADGRIEGRPWLSGSSQLGYANSRRSGDVNGDGYGDLLSGAYFYDEGGTDSGAAFLYLGGPAGFVGVAAIPDRSAPRVVGEDRHDYCGTFVDTAPDVHRVGLVAALGGSARQHGRHACHLGATDTKAAT